MGVILMVVVMVMTMMMMVSLMGVLWPIWTWKTNSGTSSTTMFISSHFGSDGDTVPKHPQRVSLFFHGTGGALIPFAFHQ